MYKEINKCRICGNKSFKTVIYLGYQSLTGVFPKSRDEIVTSGPLELVKCSNIECGLIQLKHTFNHFEMYGDNYGYRSGINNSMKKHLQEIYLSHKKHIKLKKEDLVVDIGCNDGTLLNFYAKHKLNLIGIDPTANKFKNNYDKSIKIISDFFKPNIIHNYFQGRKAKVINTIAMLYDLDNPVEFIKNIYEILDNDGIWIIEQSYLPAMIKNNAYDTICHEHLEYYGIKQLKRVFDRMKLKIIEIEENKTNGGSIKVIVSKTTSKRKECIDDLKHFLQHEEKLNLENMNYYRKFSNNIRNHKTNLIKLLEKIKAENKLILGYGASTKGNVLLQYCGISIKELPFIAEVNEDKFGSYTPQSLIPIISESEARKMNPDYYLVLPWHFKDTIIKKEAVFLKNGGKLIFPLPKIEII